MKTSIQHSDDLAALLKSIRACTICKDLPLGPNPILQADTKSKILIVGQAPGRITHHKGIPFDDPSGIRLRDWMGVSSETFYNAEKLAILPMGFCFPGTGKGGDLPPPIACAAAWRADLMARLPHVELTLILGQYAIDWHIGDTKKRTLTSHVLEWEDHLPSRLILPHPSPRNNRWLKKNPWFEQDVLPRLKKRVSELLEDH